MRKRQRLTIEEFADELAVKWHKPFETRDHTYQGEVFCSDIVRIAENAGYKKVGDWTKLFRALKQRGFWVHS